MGETVAEALAPGSQFLAAITSRRINRNTLTVTLWTYPDSFDAFRQIKKELYHMGFAVAAGRWKTMSRSPPAPMGASRPRNRSGFASGAATVMLKPCANIPFSSTTAVARFGARWKFRPRSRRQLLEDPAGCGRISIGPSSWPTRP